MIYGYARVSSVGQALYGTSLEAQIEELKQRGAAEIYSEAYTGTKVERPEFKKVLEKLKKGDTLMVTKLDRFSRTAEEGSLIVKDLLDKGINVHILNMGLIENTPTGRLMMQMLLAFAEFERNQIVERTQAGKARARAEGRRAEGRNKKVPDNFADYQRQINKGELSISQACKEMNISRTTYYTIVKEHRYKA